jgi:hypothetical protein
VRAPRALHRPPVEALVGAAVVIAVLTPVLARRGYVLSYDLVFVPDPPVTGRVLGTDGSVPRAVPSDLVVAILARLVPADVVEKVVLAGVVLLAAWGAGRLTRRVVVAGPAAPAAAALAYAWSPYLAERLVLGHWALLLGWATLPWVVDAAADARAGCDRGTARTCWWLAVGRVRRCGSDRTGGAAAVLALVAPARGVPRVRGRVVAVVLAAAAALAAPWLGPHAAAPGWRARGRRGVDAFAAAADTPAGHAREPADRRRHLERPPSSRPSAAVPVLAVIALTLAVAALMPVSPGWSRDRPGGAWGWCSQPRADSSSLRARLCRAARPHPGDRARRARRRAVARRAEVRRPARTRGRGRRGSPGGPSRRGGADRAAGRPAVVAAAVTVALLPVACCRRWRGARVATRGGRLPRRVAARRAAVAANRDPWSCCRGTVPPLPLERRPGGARPGTALVRRRRPRRRRPPVVRPRRRGGGPPRRPHRRRRRLPGRARPGASGGGCSAGCLSIAARPAPMPSWPDCPTRDPP